jgi:signal peptidase II
VRATLRVLIALASVALLLVVDGASKSWAATELRARGPRTVAGGLLRLRYHENPGFAFGLGGRRPAALTVTSALMATVLLGLLLRPRPPLMTAGLAGLLAGTAGNLRDRIERGHVVDFIERGRWPLFNVADACLAVGMALCLVGLVLKAKREA